LLLIQGQQFLAIDRDIAWGFDSQANLSAINVHYGNADVVPNENLLA
jgi:hypothetical protein